MHADYTVQETLCTVYALFPGPTTTLFRKKKLKIGFMVLYTHLKLILLQYFQFSVFNKINCIQMDPESKKVIPLIKKKKKEKQLVKKSVRNMV